MRLFVAVGTAQRRERPRAGGGHDQRRDAAEDDRGDGPRISVAARPDSNAPNSFEVVVKTDWMAVTRPRIASGVLSWTKPLRITPPTTSNPPSITSISKDSQSWVEIAKPIVAMPNPMTETKASGPTRRRGGRRESSAATSAAPTPGALRK